MFTAQHYKTIGWIIKTCPTPLNDTEVKEHLIKEFIELLEADNSKFRKDRFKEYINREV